MWLLRQPIGTQLERLLSVKGGWFVLGFAEAKLASAAADANSNNWLFESTVPQAHIQVTKADRERVLRRAERCQEVLKDKRILWIDDQVTFLAAHRRRPVEQCVPVIFYISHRDRDRGVPVSAFGITNRPDKLLHLVIDALERRA